MNIKNFSQYNLFYPFVKAATVNVTSNIMIPLAGSISVAFMGHLSNLNYLAGVALGSMLFSFVYQSFSFVKSATTTVTSQAVGKDDREAILLGGLQNALIALGLGLLLLLLQYPLGKLGIMVLATTTDVKLAGLAYFNARIWAAPAALLNLVLFGWFLGREQNRKVLFLTIIGNAANIALDYLFIVHYHWSSMGVGLSQAINQYIVLFLGVGMIIDEFSLKEIINLREKILKMSAFKQLFVIGGNLSIRSMVMLSMFFLFNNFSATLGTDVLAGNALLLSILALTMYMSSGIGYATITFIGKFKGQGATHKFLPVLQISLGINFAIALVFGIGIISFPEMIFHLFTNHPELIEAIKVYIPWLILVIIGSGMAYIVGGYFIGLGDGAVIRNTYLVSGSLGFISLVLSTFYFHSNHFLWLSFSLFMLSCCLIMSVQIPLTLQSNDEESSAKLVLTPME